MADLGVLVRATLGLYADAARKASTSLLRHAWLVGMVPAYTLLLGLVETTAAGLGLAGGFLVFLATAAGVSSFLAVLSDAVTLQRINFGDFGATFGRYLGRVVSILFLFWIVDLVLGLVRAGNPDLAWLSIAVHVGIFVVFNPVPELIYLGSQDGLALLQEAATFTRDNLLEWLLPTAVFLLPFFLIDLQVGFLVMARLDVRSALDLAIAGLATWLPFSGVAAHLFLTAAASTLLVWIMLFRGVLFRSLHRSGRRQRLFASRASGWG